MKKHKICDHCLKRLNNKLLNLLLTLLFDFESSGFFPGFSRGIIVACFQMAGILADKIDELKILQRKSIPKGPRCFKWRIVLLSAPVSVEFLLFFIASLTEWGVNGVKLRSSL